MGMYTQIVIGVELKKNTPGAAIAQLAYMTGQRENPVPIEDLRDINVNREFFACNRWSMTLRCDSYYFDWQTMNFFEFDNISSAFFLTVVSNLKNYDGEIAKFLLWIAPYLETEGFIGFTRYEEAEHPTLIYNEDGVIRFTVVEGQL